MIDYGDVIELEQIQVLFPIKTGDLYFSPIILTGNIAVIAIYEQTAETVPCWERDLVTFIEAKAIHIKKDGSIKVSVSKDFKLVDKSLVAHIDKPFRVYEAETLVTVLKIPVL